MEQAGNINNEDRQEDIKKADAKLTDDELNQVSGGLMKLLPDGRPYFVPENYGEPEDTPSSFVPPLVKEEATKEKNYEVKTFYY